MTATDPRTFDWRIERAPIDWGNLPEGYLGRNDLAPSKVEMIGGKLFINEEQPLMMIGLLLENLGVDAVVRLGDPEVWKQAVANLRDKT